MRRTLALAGLAGVLGGCFHIGIEQCSLGCDEDRDCPRNWACNPQGLCVANAAAECPGEPAAEPDAPQPTSGPDPDPATAPDAVPPDAAPPADATRCGEAACVAVFGAYVSHYNGENCTGTESYYTPYFNSSVPPMPNPDGHRYSWDGAGFAGTQYRTVTNRSWRDTAGVCHNDWPMGNTLDWFVTIYR